MSKRAAETAETPSKKAKEQVILHDGDTTTQSLEAPFVKLFTAATPNGHKVQILLELLGLSYHFRAVNIKEESKTEWYLKLNPAGKIPLLEDVDAQGEQLLLAESGAILLYLAEKYDTEHKFSYAPDTANHWKEVEFVLFHASGLNPEQKQYNVTKATEPKNEDTIARFLAGTFKAYQLLEDTLAANGDWLVGDHISLADIIAFPHAQGLVNSDVDTSKFPHVKKWVERIAAIPEVKAAIERTA